MENKTKIGIGVVLLAGVGYYFYNKNKSKISNVTSTITDEPKKSGFDREKASKEFAGFGIKKFNEQTFKFANQPTKTAIITNAQTGELTMSMATPTKREPITELFLYKQMLATLNGIPDDSDAEFTYNQFRIIYEFGDNKYKPDLDTQIRLEKIQQKYPTALKNLDLG
jgi:hypothetical protein